MRSPCAHQRRTLNFVLTFTFIWLYIKTTTKRLYSVKGGVNMSKFLTYASTFNLFLSGLSLGLAFSPYRRLSMILSFVVLIAGIVLLHLTVIYIIKSLKGD